MPPEGGAAAPPRPTPHRRGGSSSYGPRCILPCDLDRPDDAALDAERGAVDPRCERARHERAEHRDLLGRLEALEERGRADLLEELLLHDARRDAARLREAVH